MQQLSDLNFVYVLNARFSKRSLTDLLQQDSVGNVYINKQGRDCDLGGIALAFPLDEHKSPQLFVGAFTVFSQLASQDLLCGLTLMGYTSSKKGSVGLEMWAASTAASLKSVSPSPQLGCLNQFSNLPNPPDFIFSAVFQVSDTTSDTLKLDGSFVLMAQAQKSVLDVGDVTTHVRDFPRAPRLLIEGCNAEKIAMESIRRYSEYIAALFDNFD
jgi:hypothetical protein